MELGLSSRLRDPPFGGARITGDHLRGVDDVNVAPSTRTRNGVTLQGMVLRALALGLAAVALLGCGGGIMLHAPVCVACSSRNQPTKVDLEPLAVRSGASLSTQVSFAAPGPAAVMTSAMKAELASRALEGGAPGGYVVRCMLDRFAVRVFAGFFGVRVTTTLYADLACEAVRAADRVPLWRGALRGRAAARGGGLFARETTTVQELADRMMSDVARELASDLALRVLGLSASPSDRVFANEHARSAFAGTDDTALGPVALGEKPDQVRAILPALRDPDSATRATAWNAVAMATGPDEPWVTDERVTLDDEPLVRFHQYKALARRGSTPAKDQLRAALAVENEPWLSEFIADALASDGLGLSRPTNASSVTSGTQTSP